MKILPVNHGIFVRLLITSPISAWYVADVPRKLKTRGQVFWAHGCKNVERNSDQGYSLPFSIERGEEEIFYCQYRAGNGLGNR